MISLASNSITATQSTRNGVTTTSIVDTLLVRYVEIQLAEGSILAIIDRGQMVDVPAIPATDKTPEVPATKKFVATDTPLWVDVRPDGTFVSRDGAWTGNVASASQITAGLKQAFDGFLMASGAVTGTVN
jgi:hypothetical protein